MLMFRWAWSGYGEGKETPENVAATVLATLAWGPQNSANCGKRVSLFWSLKKIYLIYPQKNETSRSQTQINVYFSNLL